MTFHLYFRMADFTAARITALRPGASPPPVQIPIQRIAVMEIRMPDFGGYGSYRQWTVASFSARRSRQITDPESSRLRIIATKNHCTEIVTGGLVPPHSVAVTVVVMPDAVELTVAAPPLMEGITAVLEIVQVTTLVTSC